MPHYYPCPENESLGGKGYSGWTALANRALAAGCDRNLLRVPADLGFYDQRRPEILEEQVALAKRYGISAFCFYAYLSGGEIAWGVPLSHMLGQGAPDMPYCICLSDSTPDFNKKGILDSRMDGVDSPFEIQGLMAHLKNPRYLKVAGKPLLLLDVDSSETDYKTRISHLREYSLKEGLEGLYIVLVRPARLAILSGLPTDLGFDAALELPAIPSGHTPYSGFAAACAGAEFPAYPQFRCAYAGWEGGLVGDTPPDPTLKDPSPGAFQAWLEALAEEARVQHFGEERMVFIHAWNDWVHGASLEPDQRFGHTYLEAVRNALDAPGALEKNKRYLLN